MTLDPRFFSYGENGLCVEGVALEKIAESLGTPCYVYSQSMMESNFRDYESAFAGQNATICYAVKACPNLSVIRVFGAMGSGADVVSEGELRRALEAGIPANKIVFAGVGKTVQEMRYALDCGIMYFSAESLPELQMLQQVASSLDKKARVALRVNPNVDAKTHAKITTGKNENKFGIDLGVLPQAVGFIKSCSHIELLGLAMHIGSQLTDAQPFADAMGVLRRETIKLRSAGFECPVIDVGGGLGISYQGQTIPAVSELARIAEKEFGDLGCRLTLAPGRSLTGAAGVLLSRVIFVKQGTEKKFVVIDAAMNDLLRPTLYQAHHEIHPVQKSAVAMALADLVGPVCESGDYLAQDRMMPSFKGGDLLVLAGAGAYGASMSSNYNSRPLAAEVLVRGEHFAPIRERQSIETQWRSEVKAPWQ